MNSTGLLQKCTVVSTRSVGLTHLLAGYLLTRNTELGEAKRIAGVRLLICCLSAAPLEMYVRRQAAAERP